MIETMAFSGKKLFSKDIDEAEAQLKLVFPESYRNFLLKYNGGSPEECAFDFNGDKLKVQGDDIKYFFNLGGKKTNDVVHKSLSKDFIVPEGVILIANTHTSNFFLLSLREDSYGQIFYKDHEFEDTLQFDPQNNVFPESIVKVSDSFEGFISNLYDPDD